MSKRQRTAEEACVEYAIAAESVREQTRVMRNNRCEGESKGEIGASGYREGAQDSCLNQHWTIVLEGSGDHAREVPELDYEDMCDECKTRLHAFKDRRDARKRLGAAKRAVENAGKRLMAATA